MRIGQRVAISTYMLKSRGYIVHKFKAWTGYQSAVIVIYLGLYLSFQILDHNTLAVKSEWVEDIDIPRISQSLIPILFSETIVSRRHKLETVSSHLNTMDSIGK